MSRLNILEDNVIAYEVRPSAAVQILTEQGSPWQAFKSDSKVIRPDVVDVMEHAFECGGFVAGGCGRWLRNVGTVTALKRGVYVHEGGDVDFFFRTPEGWSAFLKRYCENSTPTDGPVITLSEGKLAANVTFAGKKAEHNYNGPPKMQAIRCVTGTPEEVLRSFDFVNSMVAFDRCNTWVAEGWEAYEAEKRLAIAWWGSRSIAFRVRKYMNKYGYNAIVDVSKSMFDELVDGTNGMSESRKMTSRDMWLGIVQNVELDVEKKLLILASTAQGIETNDLFTLMQSEGKVVPKYNGSYANVMNELIGRQERAEQLTVENQPLSKGLRHRGWIDEYLDELGEKDPAPQKPFNADEYCWAR